MLCYSACSVRRDCTLGDLSLEQKTVLHELETTLSERKAKEEISVWALTALKEKKSRFTRAWGRMPRISLEALVCAGTKASSLQVNLLSYHFQMNQEKSNIHKPEEQDLKGSQMWTQNLCCLFSDILSTHAVLLQCQVTPPKRQISGWSLINSRGLFWPVLPIWALSYFFIGGSYFHLWFSLCFFSHIAFYIYFFETLWFWVRT